MITLIRSKGVHPLRKEYFQHAMHVRKIYTTLKYDIKVFLRD